jgi:hypothetical protein
MRKNAMKQFINKHTQKINGTIACFDRILFKGYLPISWAENMQRFIIAQGFLFKDFKVFVTKHSEQIKQHARTMAETTERPYIHINGKVRKEEKARQIANQDGITEGLICVLSAVEACQSFKLAYGKGRPKLVNAPRKCLCLYFYFIDREFGFMHVRIPTWFPFTIQIYLNGHDWLARKMDHHGIEYRKVENAFLWIADPKRAQRFSNQFAKKKWPCILHAFAYRFNPLLKDLLKCMDYYWIVEQAEFATDQMFIDRATLKPLYQELLKYATLCFSAEDVLMFLGRKLHGRFEGEVLNEYKKRWPGARVKHRMKENGIKMYDKHGSVLRIETVINRPYEFKVRRRGRRKGQEVIGWFPMAKGVANLYRYAEVSSAANARYLDALAAVDDPAKAQQHLNNLGRSVRRNGKSYRGFNPVAKLDLQLFLSVLRGEHSIMGFRNRDIRLELFPETKDRKTLRRQSSKVSRLLKRLHIHKLIAKIPRSRRWRVTAIGHSIMCMLVRLHHDVYSNLAMNQIA